MTSEQEWRRSDSVPPHTFGDTCIYCEDNIYDQTRCDACDGAGVDDNGHACEECGGCGGFGYAW